MPKQILDTKNPVTDENFCVRALQALTEQTDCVISPTLHADNPSLLRAYRLIKYMQYFVELKEDELKVTMNELQSFTDLTN